MGLPAAPGRARCFVGASYPTTPPLSASRLKFEGRTRIRSARPPRRPRRPDPVLLRYARRGERRRRRSGYRARHCALPSDGGRRAGRARLPAATLWAPHPEPCHIGGTVANRTTASCRVYSSRGPEYVRWGLDSRRSDDRPGQGKAKSPDPIHALLRDLVALADLPLFDPAPSPEVDHGADAPGVRASPQSQTRRVLGNNPVLRGNQSSGDGAAPIGSSVARSTSLRRLR